MASDVMTGWGILLTKSGKQKLFCGVDVMVYPTRSEARYIAKKIVFWGNAEKSRVVKLQITETTQ